ncbi:MAG: hypothetical protein ABI782_09105 [Anaerolineaceae bacterium]
MTSPPRQWTLCGARIWQSRISSSPTGPIAFDVATKSILLVAGGTLRRIDPATGSTLSATPLPGAPARVCGIAVASKTSLFIAEEGTGRLFLFNPVTRKVRQVAAVGEMPAQPCLMTIALRR